jgi:putative tricarboxylic transport membrane protein
MVDMAHAFVSGLYQLFVWPTFGFMLVGMAVGFMVGILPGLGGATTLALMLPFIFTMKSVDAFAFLLGMTAVTATTGDITSILFGVPGEATTASTIVDGHPMAKNGEAGRALGAALMSSLVGAVFGAFALAVAIPIVRPLVLLFGSPEFFMLALLGITFVASLSGSALVKGLIAGGLGLMLGSVGMDPISGVQRYTFGQLFLWDGVGLVPVTIGLFAIPEIIDLSVKGTSIAEQQMGKIGGVMEGIKDTFRHWWLVIRCSAIGTYIGVIPGMGGGVSQWIAYAHAVQSSPDRERFGRGAVEGVIGPGAANNSTIGGALIPTVAFGVPGSVSTAILLGAFLILGLVPGPDMLIPEPKGRLTLTYSLVWIIVLSNILTVAVCLLFLNPLAKITQVRGSLLTPFILWLIYIGAFAEKNAFQDLVVVLVFGALGWLMVRLDWPRPPLVLGLVLAPLAENRLFLATGNYGLSWLWRPGVLCFFAIILASLLYPFLKNMWQWRGSVPQPSTPRTVRRRDWASSRVSLGVVFTGGIIALLASALWMSRGFGFRAGLFPWAIGLPVLALAIVQLVLDLHGPREQSVSRARVVEDEAELPTRIVYRRTAGIAAWVVGFFAAIWGLGVATAVPVTTFLFLKVGGGEKWPISLLCTAGLWLLVYGLFIHTLHIPFPEGLLWGWLE